MMNDKPRTILDIENNTSMGDSEKSFLRMLVYTYLNKKDSSKSRILKNVLNTMYPKYLNNDEVDSCVKLFMINEWDDMKDE